MKLHDILSEAILTRAPERPVSHTQQMIKKVIPGKTHDVSDQRDQLTRLVSSNKRMKAVADEVSKDTDHEFVGAGLNAYVHRTNDQHSLDRVHRTAKSDEGTNMYLDFVHTHPKLHSNPFFPKVRGSQPRSNGAVTMHIERLVPFTAPGLGDNVELLLSLWDRYLEADPPVRYGTKGYRDSEDDHVFAERVGQLLISYIENVIIFGRGAKDLSLRQACAVLHYLKTEHDMSVDLHPGNVMWRLTSVGPQLVITDPLWGGLDSLNDT